MGCSTSSPATFGTKQNISHCTIGSVELMLKQESNRRRSYRPRQPHPLLNEKPLSDEARSDTATLSTSSNLTDLDELVSVTHPLREIDNSNQQHTTTQNPCYEELNYGDEDSTFDTREKIGLVWSKQAQTGDPRCCHSTWNHAGSCCLTPL